MSPRNLYYNVQGAFPIQPWYGYLVVLKYWTGLGALILVLSLIGATELPQLFVAAAVITLTYSFIGHKELRFIYPVILLTTILSGIGLAQVASWITEGLVSEGWTRRRAVLRTSAATLAVVVLAQLCFVGGSDVYQTLWTRGRDMLRASWFVARMNSVCGIGLLDRHWDETGGYAAFHHAVPLYWGTASDPLDRASLAFNTVIYDRGKLLGTGYVERACFGDVCVAQRSGACFPVPMKEATLKDLSYPPRPLDDWKPELGR
jgi:GPI mannosyltransferase 3